MAAASCIGSLASRLRRAACLPPARSAGNRCRRTCAHGVVRGDPARRLAPGDQGQGAALPGAHPAPGPGDLRELGLGPGAGTRRRGPDHDRRRVLLPRDDRPRADPGPRERARDPDRRRRRRRLPARGAQASGRRARHPGRDRRRRDRAQPALAADPERRRLRSSQGTRGDRRRCALRRGVRGPLRRRDRRFHRPARPRCGPVHHAVLPRRPRAAEPGRHHGHPVRQSRRSAPRSWSTPRRPRRPPASPWSTTI